jgi:hypothetical protein
MLGGSSWFANRRLGSFDFYTLTASGLILRKLFLSYVVWVKRAEYT